MINDFGNKMTFDLICGINPGDLNAITEEDIRAMAAYWIEQGDTVPESDIQKAIAGLEEYRKELRQDDNPSAPIYGPAKWREHSVLLKDGTVGSVLIPECRVPESIVGLRARVDLADENGMPIQVSGDIASILD